MSITWTLLGCTRWLDPTSFASVFCGFINGLMHVFALSQANVVLQHGLCGNMLPACGVQLALFPGL